jgi:hypothetical protein
MTLYSAFGLKIESAIALSAPVAVAGAPDVWVRLGATPGSLDDAQLRAEGIEASPDQFLITLEGTARYLVRNGREIIVEPLQGADASNATLEAYLFGPAFGALFHQRGDLPLHASAIEVGDGCVIFLGQTGSGKSTMAAAFAERGHRVLSDDVCRISFENGQAPVVNPGLPHMKILDDAADQLGLTAAHLPLEDPQSPKRRLALGARFCEAGLRLKRAYVLEPSDNPGVRIETVEGVAKAILLLNYTYRPWFVVGRQARATQFRTCTRVGAQTTVKRVSRRQCENLLESVLDRVAEDFADLRGSP